MQFESINATFHVNQHMNTFDCDTVKFNLLLPYLPIIQLKIVWNWIV